MSHNKERKEKICLNCNAVLYGRYCHICGQENIEPKEGFWHLVNHFVEDITHFDGNFFVVQFYQYKAMRNFYRQSRIKTILKFCIFNFVTLMIFIFIGVIFFLNTASEQIN